MMKLKDKNVLRWQLVIVVIILLIMAICTRKVDAGLQPPPEPNDCPFSFDVNECNAPPMDWIVSEPGESWTYAVKYISLAGVDVNLTASDPNIVVQYIEKTHDANDPEDPNGPKKYWQQKFELYMTYYDGGIYYIELQARMKNGRLMDKRTLLLCVEKGYIYPFQKPLVTSPVTWSQQVVQRARKEGKYPAFLLLQTLYGGDIPDTTIVHRWN